MAGNAIFHICNIVCRKYGDGTSHFCSHISLLLLAPKVGLVDDGGKTICKVNEIQTCLG